MIDQDMAKDYYKHYSKNNNPYAIIETVTRLVNDKFLCSVKTEKTFIEIEEYKKYVCKNIIDWIHT